MGNASAPNQEGSRIVCAFSPPNAFGVVVSFQHAGQMLRFAIQPIQLHAARDSTIIQSHGVKVLVLAIAEQHAVSLQGRNRMAKVAHHAWHRQLMLSLQLEPDLLLKELTQATWDHQSGWSTG